MGLRPDSGTFLRGGVLTNSSGVAHINTVYRTSDGSFTGGTELHTDDGGAASGTLTLGVER